MSIYLAITITNTINKNINHQYTLQFFFLMIPGIMIRQPAACYIQAASYYGINASKHKHSRIRIDNVQLDNDTRFVFTV